MTIPAAIVAQFKRPQGLLGRVAGSIMASRPSNRQRNLWTVAQLGIDPEDRVLEIGCGPGFALAACAEHLNSGMVTGLDHSGTMLAQAEKRNREAISANRVQLWQGDLDRLATLCGEFDKVFSVNVVQFFEHRSEAFRTLSRLCAPGGLVASTYQPRHSGASRDDALRMARKIEDDMGAAGFVDMRCEKLALLPAPAVCILGKRPLE